jgi:hypothetical protein
MSKYPFKHETVIVVHAPVHEVFDFVDDHARLSSHMTQRSWMMVGGSMSIETDAGRGRAVGSRLKLHGTVLGVRLSVEEIVTERTPPIRKFWETTGEPGLLVIGSYRMGIEIDDRAGASRMRVSIEYSLPQTLPSRWLGSLFGRRYASWCTGRMANDAFRHFESSASHKRSPK